MEHSHVVVAAEPAQPNLEHMSHTTRNVPTRGAVAGRQTTLSIRDRQFIAATRREAEMLECQRPGVLHKMVLETGGRNVRVSYFFNLEHRKSSGGTDDDEASVQRKHTPGKAPTKPMPKRDGLQNKSSLPTGTSKLQPKERGSGKVDPSTQPASESGKEAKKPRASVRPGPDP